MNTYLSLVPRATLKPPHCLPFDLPLRLCLPILPTVCSGRFRFLLLSPAFTAACAFACTRCRPADGFTPPPTTHRVALRVAPSAAVLSPSLAAPLPRRYTGFGAAAGVASCRAFLLLPPLLYGQRTKHRVNNRRAVLMGCAHACGELAARRVVPSPRLPTALGVGVLAFLSTSPWRTGGKKSRRGQRWGGAVEPRRTAARRPAGAQQRGIWLPATALLSATHMPPRSRHCRASPQRRTSRLGAGGVGGGGVGAMQRCAAPGGRCRA
jgi:hypothetical protein